MSETRRSQLARVIQGEIDRQSQEMNLYNQGPEPDAPLADFLAAAEDVLVDGRIDLLALADAILLHEPLLNADEVAP